MFNDNVQPIPEGVRQEVNEAPLPSDDNATRPITINVNQTIFTTGSGGSNEYRATSSEFIQRSVGTINFKIPIKEVNTINRIEHIPYGDGDILLRINHPDGELQKFHSFNDSAFDPSVRLEACPEIPNIRKGLIPSHPNDKSTFQMYNVDFDKNDIASICEKTQSYTFEYTSLRYPDFIKTSRPPIVKTFTLIDTFSRISDNHPITSLKLLNREQLDDRVNHSKTSLYAFFSSDETFERVKRRLLFDQRMKYIRGQDQTILSRSEIQNVIDRSDPHSAETRSLEQDLSLFSALPVYERRFFGTIPDNAILYTLSDQFTMEERLVSLFKGVGGVCEVFVVAQEGRFIEPTTEVTVHSEYAKIMASTFLFPNRRIQVINGSETTRFIARYLIGLVCQPDKVIDHTNGDEAWKYFSYLDHLNRQVSMRLWLGHILGTDTISLPIDGTGKCFLPDNLASISKKIMTPYNTFNEKIGNAYSQAITKHHIAATLIKYAEILVKFVIEHKINPDYMLSGGPPSIRSSHLMVDANAIASLMLLKNSDLVAFVTVAEKDIMLAADVVQMKEQFTLKNRLKAPSELIQTLAPSVKYEQIIGFIIDGMKPARFPVTKNWVLDCTRQMWKYAPSEEFDKHVGQVTHLMEPVDLCSYDTLNRNLEYCDTINELVRFFSIFGIDIKPGFRFMNDERSKPTDIDFEYIIDYHTRISRIGEVARNTIMNVITELVSMLSFNSEISDSRWDEGDFYSGNAWTVCTIGHCPSYIQHREKEMRLFVRAIPDVPLTLVADSYVMLESYSTRADPKHIYTGITLVEVDMEFEVPKIFKHLTRGKLIASIEASMGVNVIDDANRTVTRTNLRGISTLSNETKLAMFKRELCTVYNSKLSLNWIILEFEECYNHFQDFMKGLSERSGEAGTTRFSFQCPVIRTYNTKQTTKLCLRLSRIPPTRDSRTMLSYLEMRVIQDIQICPFRDTLLTDLPSSGLSVKLSDIPCVSVNKTNMILGSYRYGAQERFIAISEVITLSEYVAVRHSKSSHHDSQSNIPT